MNDVTPIYVLGSLVAVMALRAKASGSRSPSVIIVIDFEKFKYFFVILFFSLRTLEKFK